MFRASSSISASGVMAPRISHEAIAAKHNDQNYNKGDQQIT
ncbi:hypothetical protein Z949_2167 [Sulfitobacter guttiformis KCTC 32187]|nr:hypothetical protein Z949_2167 [Sulfitobacter guttiformis KCTC 32187]